MNLELVAVDGDAHCVAAHLYRQSKRCPAGWHVRVQRDTVCGQLQSRETESQRLPQAPHRGEMQSTRGGSCDVVEVEASDEPQEFHSLIRPAEASEQPRMELPGESELPWAVRGS